MKKIFIVAGDPSGDIHASRLMESLKSLHDEIEFIGIGGGKMTAAGLNSIVPIEKMSVVGFWEVAKRYVFFKEIFNKCVRIFRSEQIDAFIPVDYPGFNLKLSKNAKELGIPVIYYIAPQLWAWGKNRAKKLSDRIDLLLTVFPFEADFFAEYGINVKFIGHPLLDDPVFPNDLPDYSVRQKLLAFLPGSREQELVNHLPIMKKIGKDFLDKHKDYRIGVSFPDTVDKSIYNKLVTYNNKWELWDNSRELMLNAKAGIVKTGTSNLEAALCGLPFLMIYRTSSLSYFLGRHLVNLPYLSLVNILSQKKIISEYIQKDIDTGLIINKLNELITEDRYNEYQRHFVEIKKSLGKSGASMNAAKAIAEVLL